MDSLFFLVAEFILVVKQPGGIRMQKTAENKSLADELSLKAMFT